MSFNYGYIVDASRQKGDEGRGVTAISLGEVSSNRYQPGISEWGNPVRVMSNYPLIFERELTLGSETSQYQEEKKANLARGEVIVAFG